MKKHLGFTLVLIVGVFLMSSCVTQKQVKYLQKQQGHDTTSFYQNSKNYNYRIKSKDNLYIKIFSLDEKSYFFFNKQASGTTSASDYNSDVSIYLNSYSVNDSGYIDFPLIGNISVVDLTTEQVKHLIRSKISDYLKETTVVVKLVNFNISVLGEVRTPGEKKVYQDKINIFEAISIAGDMTDFADRGKVAIIRQTPGGSKVIYLNMNSGDILASDYYYLMPNDIIYVAPLGIKRWGTESFPWALVLSAVSTTLLLINYFK